MRFRGLILIISLFPASWVLFLIVKNNNGRKERSFPREHKLFPQNQTLDHITHGSMANVSVEKKNIFFLKTHKCASSTVQNILMRFGYRRQLDFVLPVLANYLGHPAAFNRDMIHESLESLSGKYNIFAHHTRYNYTEVKAVMNENASFVTILRDPADLFESLYVFYNLQHRTNMTFQNLLKLPSLWKKLSIRSQKQRLGTNQMSFDLGLNLAGSLEGSLKLRFIKDFIQRIDEQFDLVMITEHVETSLVLLADLMNWPLENVVFLKVNSRPNGRKLVLSPAERNSVLEMNSADTQLYNYFYSKFKNRVAKFGAQKMRGKVEKLLQLNSDLWKNCVDRPNAMGFAHTTSYNIRNPTDFTCFHATRQELLFTDQIREDHIVRLSALRKLDRLLSDVLVK